MSSGGDSQVAQPKNKRRKIGDFTLANRLEDSRLIRELLRDHGRLVRWPSKETVNVFNLSVLGLNSRLMCMIADYHCQQTKKIQPPTIDFLKAQDGGGERVHINQKKL